MLQVMPRAIQKRAIPEEAKKLREFRDAKGLSRDALAELVHSHRNTIQKLEMGERKLTVQWIEKLGPKLGKTKDDFFANDTPLPAKGASVIVPEYDVRAGAGTGLVIDRETRKDTWVFSRRYLSEEMHLPTKNLVVVEVVGDSMEPTLRSGDRVLVNMDDKRLSQPGIFVLWDGDGVAVKRLELVPGSAPAKVLRISDNPIHERREALAEHTNIIGRVVWVARRM